MQTVELFSGTGSFSKVAKKEGHSIFRVELDKRFRAELHKDILELQREDLPKKINILWASPPCTAFSVASLRHYWVDGKPKNARTWHGLNMVMKTLELIKEIKKDNPNLIWFIENPRGMLRKQKFMKGLHKQTVTYCRYGDFRQKPTDIWNNMPLWVGKRICRPGARCHASAKRGSDKGTQSMNNAEDRSVIPPALFEEILYYFERHLDNKSFLSDFDNKGGV